jgi:hypothetical protein
MIFLAVAKGERRGEARQLGDFPNRAYHLGRFVERLAKKGRRLAFCYEAALAAMAFAASSRVQDTSAWRRRIPDPAEVAHATMAVSQSSESFNNYRL